MLELPSLVVLINLHKVIAGNIVGTLRVFYNYNFLFLIPKLSSSGPLNIVLSRMGMIAISDVYT